MGFEDHRRLFTARSAQTNEAAPSSEDGSEESKTDGIVRNLKRRRHREHQRAQKEAGNERRAARAKEKDTGSMNQLAVETLKDDEVLKEVLRQEFASKELRFDPSFTETLKDITDHPARWSDTQLVVELVDGAEEWSNRRGYFAALYHEAERRGLL